MFDQRELSIQIVQANGDYLWIVKDNQEGSREEIDMLFQPHRKRAATSALPNDFRMARTVEKGHGRLDKRTITVSLLANYSTWPELAQVFKLESQRTNVLGTTKTEVRYGVTSLPVCLADATRLLELTRGHWGSKKDCIIDAMPRCAKITPNCAWVMHPRSSQSSTTPSLDSLPDWG